MWNTWPAHEAIGLAQKLLVKRHCGISLPSLHTISHFILAMCKCVWPPMFVYWPCGHTGMRAFVSKKVPVKNPTQQVVSTVRNNNNRAQSRALLVIGTAKHWRHFRKETPLALTLHKRRKQPASVVWVPRPFWALNNYYQQASALIMRLVLESIYVLLVFVFSFTRN